MTVPTWTRAELERAAEELTAACELQGRAFEMSLREGASESALRDLESKLDTPLPPSYRTFLAQTNGLFLNLRGETDDAFAELGILPDDAVFRATKSTRDLDEYASPERAPSRLIEFAYWADMLVMDPARANDGEYAVLAPDHDEATAWHTHFPPIAPSFGVWLERVLENVRQGGNFNYWPY